MVKRLLLLIIALFLFVILAAGCTGTQASGDDALPEKLTRGTVAGNLYVSACAKLNFNAPDDWKFLTDEELADLMGVSKINGDSAFSFSDEVLKLGQIIDMMTGNPCIGNVVTIVYEKLDDGTRLRTEEEWLEDFMSILRADSPSVSEDASGRVIGTNTYKVVYGPTALGNAQYYCIRKVGDYMLVVYIVANNEDEIPEIMERFS